METPELGEGKRIDRINDYLYLPKRSLIKGLIVTETILGIPAHAGNRIEDNLISAFHMGKQPLPFRA